MTLTKPLCYLLTVGKCGPVVEGWHLGLVCGPRNIVPMRGHELQERGRGQSAWGPTPGPRGRAHCLTGTPIPPHTPIPVPGKPFGERGHRPSFPSRRREERLPGTAGSEPHGHPETGTPAAGLLPLPEMPHVRLTQGLAYSLKGPIFREQPTCARHRGRPGDKLREGHLAHMRLTPLEVRR